MDYEELAKTIQTHLVREGRLLAEHEIRRAFDQLEGNGALERYLSSNNVSLSNLLQQRPDLFIRDGSRWKNAATNSFDTVLSSANEPRRGRAVGGRGIAPRGAPRRVLARGGTFATIARNQGLYGSAFNRPVTTRGGADNGFGSRPCPPVSNHDNNRNWNSSDSENNNDSSFQKPPSPSPTPPAPRQAPPSRPLTPILSPKPCPPSGSRPRSPSSRRVPNSPPPRQRSPPIRSPRPRSPSAIRPRAPPPRQRTPPIRQNGRHRSPSPYRPPSRRRSPSRIRRRSPTPRRYSPPPFRHQSPPRSPPFRRRSPPPRAPSRNSPIPPSNHRQSPNSDDMSSLAQRFGAQMYIKEPIRKFDAPLNRSSINREKREVEVVRFHHFRNFSIRFIDENEDYLRMDRELQSTMSSQNAPDRYPLGEWKYMDAAVHRARSSNVWNRAVVVGIEKQLLRLYLVDVGQYIIAPSCEVSPMPSQFLRIAPFAVKCTLAASNDEIDRLERRLSHWSDLFAENRLIPCLASSSSIPKDGVVEVDLYVTSSGELDHVRYSKL